MTIHYAAQNCLQFKVYAFFRKFLFNVYDSQLTAVAETVESRPRLVSNLRLSCFNLPVTVAATTSVTTVSGMVFYFFLHLSTAC